MFGKRGVEGGGAGLGAGQEIVMGREPLLVEGVEPVEGAAQDAELVDPAGLGDAGRNEGQLGLGGSQQVAGTGVKVLECRSGVGIALALAQAVGVVVVGPSVEVGVLVGVGVPFVEDLLGFAQVQV
ncbi:hypothetical protein [Streptomyces sp. PsTaAH-130]|uniref:hypothetical protein n=1 Tax=Streptomyces sp. SID8366 TaxID=2690348 RepID=UPI001F2D7A2A|nr:MULTISPECIES: hypothetical protein [unclassified Streptomyces]